MSDYLCRMDHKFKQKQQLNIKALIKPLSPPFLEAIYKQISGTFIQKNVFVSTLNKDCQCEEDRLNIETLSLYLIQDLSKKFVGALA